jgi:hypothetical protein
MMFVMQGGYWEEKPKKSICVSAKIAAQLGGREAAILCGYDFIAALLSQT